MPTKRNRLKVIRQPSARERGYLNQYFAVDTQPSGLELQNISEFIGMDMNRVKIWFRNRRHNAKLDKAKGDISAVAGCNLTSQRKLELVSTHNKLSLAVSRCQESCLCEVANTESYICRIGSIVRPSTEDEDSRTNFKVFPAAPSMNSAQQHKKVILAEQGDMAIAPLSFECNVGKLAVIQPPPFVLEPQPIWRASSFNAVPLQWQLIDRSPYRCEDSPWFRFS